MAFAPGLAYGRFGYAEVEKDFSRQRGSIRTRRPFVWQEGGVYGGKRENWESHHDFSDQKF